LVRSVTCAHRHCVVSLWMRWRALLVTCL